MTHAAFDVTVLTFDPHVQSVPESYNTLCARRRALREADVISVHVRLTSASRHSIGAAELPAMRPEAILVNSARGAVVDEAALIRALDERRIGAAGIDVWAGDRILHRLLAVLDVNRVLEGQAPRHPGGPAATGPGRA